MSASNSARWGMWSKVSAAAAASSLAAGTALMHTLGSRSVSAEEALRLTRVSHQRAAEDLQWLQQHGHRKQALAINAEGLGVQIVDAVTELAQQGGVLDWRIEGIDTVATEQAASSVRLVVELASAHGEDFLEQLDVLMQAAGPRPVQVTACALNRARDEASASRAPLLTRCTLDWPWWPES